MKRSLLTLVCLALAACGAQDVTTPASAAEAAASAKQLRTVNLNEQFTLAPGETVLVNGEALTVKFVGVPSDSRCPTGVQCIWAGDAVTTVTLTKTGFAAESFDLHTTLEPHSASYQGYTITLVNLDPYPNSRTGPIRPNAYRATFIVTKP